MPRKTTQTDSPLFLVVAFDDKGRVDAASQFNATPDNALKEGKVRAARGDYKKCQVYKIEIADKSELTFKHVK